MQVTISQPVPNGPFQVALSLTPEEGKPEDFQKRPGAIALFLLEAAKGLLNAQMQQVQQRENPAAGTIALGTVFDLKKLKENGPSR